MIICFVFFSSRRRHTRCALVTGVQTCALPISPADPDGARYDYTLRSRIDDLGALLRHAGIDDATPVTLAVHDWGGMIGFGWALSHMPQVQRLVVLNTAAFPLPGAKPMPWQLSLGRDSYVGGWAIRRFNLFARGAAWRSEEPTSELQSL